MIAFLIVSSCVYAILNIYAFIVLRSIVVLDKKQKIRNFCINLIFPFWIFIVRIATRSSDYYKKRDPDDRGWVRNDDEYTRNRTWYE